MAEISTQRPPAQDRGSASHQFWVARSHRFWRHCPVLTWGGPKDLQRPEGFVHPAWFQKTQLGSLARIELVLPRTTSDP